MFCQKCHTCQEVLCVSLSSFSSSPDRCSRLPTVTGANRNKTGTIIDKWFHTFNHCAPPAPQHHWNFHKDSYIIYAYVTARLCKAWLSERKTYTPFPVANVNTNSRKNALNCKRPCSLVKLPCLALWVDISCSQVQEGLANTMLPFKVSSHAPFLNTLWSMSYPYRPNNSGRKECLQLATRENPFFYQNIPRIFIKHLQPPSWMHLSVFVNAPRL